MSPLTKKLRDTLNNQMQQARNRPGVQGFSSRAVAWTQRAAQHNPWLTRVAEKVENTMSPMARKRPGSGDDVPVGSGRGGAIAITHPGADSSAKPGTPGEILYGEDPVRINDGRESITVKVVNTADRPITVGSHFHFAETNPALEFDRKAAWGRRQNIVAGGMTRFDPGAPQEIELIPFGGRRIAAGFRGECGGPIDA